MEKIKNNLFERVVAIMLTIGALVALFSGYMTKQTALEVELANIKQELIKLNQKLDNRDEKIESIIERLARLESR